MHFPLSEWPLWLLWIYDTHSKSAPSLEDQIQNKPAFCFAFCSYRLHVLWICFSDWSARLVTRYLIEMSSAVQNFQCFLDIFQSEVWIDDPVEKKKLIEDYKSALRFTKWLCVLLWNQIYNALPLMFNDIQIWIYNFFFPREKPCKYFAQGTRTCQFGASCFYKHGMEWNEKLCVLSLWRFFSSTGVT